MRPLKNHWWYIERPIPLPIIVLGALVALMLGIIVVSRVLP